MTAAGRPRTDGPADASPFPWDEVLAFGLGALRLGPAALWRLTPREVAAAARGLGLGHRSGPSRGDLADLMRAFPDAAA